MIKNFRFHVIKDLVKEGITEKQRSLFEQNKGTSIVVSNSIIRPEKIKFTTQVSESIQKLLPLMIMDPTEQHDNYNQVPEYLETQSFQSMQYETTSNNEVLTTI